MLEQSPRFEQIRRVEFGRKAQAARLEHPVSGFDDGRRTVQDYCIDARPSGAQVKRRTLLAWLCAGLAPRVVLAQRASLPVVSFVASNVRLEELLPSSPPGPYLRSFLQGLREFGWEDGRNLVIERHTAEGRLDRAQAIFADLVTRKVNVIYVSGSIGVTQMPALALRATRNIPIVFVGGGADPVAGGIVQSLARPGGNATGLTVNLGIEFGLKRLELLKEIAPRVKRVAFLGSAEEFARNDERVREGVARLGLVMLLAAVEKAADYEPAFATAVRERADAVFVSNVSLNRANAEQIVALAARHRLPAEHFFRESVRAGGLAAYGVDLNDLARRSANHVDRILRGANPADLPVERPSKFTLAINQKTARALGLTIPQTVLLRADEVIE